MATNGNPKGPLYIVGGLVLVGIIVSLILMNQQKNGADAPPAAAPAPTETVTAPPPAVAPVETPATTGTPAPAETPAAAAAPSVDLNTDAQGLSTATVTLKTTKGTIKYKFYSKDAPNHTKRMVELIQKKFYDGLTFHRVVPGFVIQGGDPQGTGMGGSGQKINAEFNKRPHLLGTVAMARAQDPNSGDSQFYICLGRLDQLDGQYTVFGQVVEGMDVVSKIQVGDKMTSVTIQ